MLPSTSQVTDEQLIARAADGDTAAFGELVDRHRAAVVRAATAALGDRDDAEDVAQEAFVAAWHALPSFRHASSFRTWTLAIAWRHALTRRRSRRGWWARLVHSGSWQWPDEGAHEPQAAGEEPEQRLLDEEFTRAVRVVVKSLGQKLRDPLMLAASGEYTMDEIAAMLGAPVGTVKWRISEARRLARQKLERMASRRS
jgi:RNA polymerase sigma-70 factor (ECF subfamily)